MNTKIMRGVGYLSWIDTAKGLGVYLVFTGHLLYQTHLSLMNTMIYSFHMPFFFILSGYVLNTEKYDVGTFIKRKFFSLIVPAYIFMLLFLPIDLMSGSSMMEIVKGMLFLNGRVTQNDPCWFYITLFQGMCILRLLNVSRKTSTTRTAMLFLSFLVV